MKKADFLKIFERYSYLLLALFLVVFESTLIYRGLWADDFWEHSAVVHELSKHLLNPENPIIYSHNPHAFFSPYSIIVAVFSKLTGLNSIQSLSWFAFFNLLFFLFSFYAFCKSVFTENPNSIAAISLFLILFFCGRNPYQWSGFYHIIIMDNMLPYPSTFANAMSFLILSMLAKAKDKWKPANIIGISLLGSMVLISHPPTALFLFIGIGSMNWALNGYSVKTGILRSAAIIIPCIVLAICWPYYHIIDLFTSKGYNFHSDSLPLYQGIISRNWPLLFVFPAFFIKRDPIIFFFLATIITLTAIYFTGYLLKVYGASKILFNLNMFADLLIGYLLVN
ncbi:MAG: hypothetical protein JST58_13840 [Bacteroidetes bacterium]|nr:hypothetical protein [Bacteroidota bacterium]